MRIIKKLIGILLALAVFSTTTLAAGGSDTLNAISVGEPMTMEEAVTLALANDITLKTIDNRILLAERQLRSAKIKADNVTLNPISDTEKLANGRTHEYTPLLKEDELDDLKYDKLEQEKTVATDIQVLYSTILKQEADLEKYKQQLEDAKLEFSQSQKQYDLGQITQSVLDTSKVATEQAKLNVSKAERSLTNLYMDFATDLGLPMNTRPVLVETSPIEDIIVDYNISALLDQVVDESRKIYEAKQDLMLAELEFDVTRRYTSYYKPDNYEDLEEAVLDKQENLDQMKQTVQIDLMTDYNNLMNTVDDIKIAELNLQTAKEAFYAAEKRYGLGMATLLDVQKAQTAVDEGENAVFSNKIDLFDLKSQFDLSIDFIK